MGAPLNAFINVIVICCALTVDDVDVVPAVGGEVQVVDHEAHGAGRGGGVQGPTHQALTGHGEHTIYYYNIFRGYKWRRLVLNGRTFTLSWLLQCFNICVYKTGN